MKTFFIASTIIGSLAFASPTFAQPDSQGQILLKGIYAPEITDDLQQVNMGTGVVTTNGYFALIGYHGIQLRIREKDTLRLLGGEYIDSLGLSGMVSGCYILQLNDKNSVLAVVDYWQPLIGKRVAQIYAYGSWDLKIAEKISLGIATENLVDVGGSWQEAALGPTVGLGSMFFLLVYDFQPTQPNGKVMLRLIHVFH
jgi:hypothetical protein